MEGDLRVKFMIQFSLKLVSFAVCRANNLMTVMGIASMIHIEKTLDSVFRTWAHGVKIDRHLREKGNPLRLRITFQKFRSVLRHLIDRRRMRDVA